MKLLYQLEDENNKNVSTLLIKFVMYAEQEPNKLTKFKLIEMKWKGK